jgi:hypothetical protein
MFRLKVVEKIKNTHFAFTCSNFFFFKNCAVYDIVEKYGTTGEATDDNIIRCMCTSCWIPKTTDTHLEYLMVFIAFPLQQWQRERATMLRYTHIANRHTLSVTNMTICNRVCEGRPCRRNVSFILHNPQFRRHGPNIPAALNVKCEADGHKRDLRLSQTFC